MPIGINERYYRSYLKQPFGNYVYPKASQIPAVQSGGSKNRFGSTLSGNPNQKLLFGSPTGGMNASYISKNRDPYLISGPYSSNIRGSGRSGGSEMQRFWNPNTLHRNTYPIPGTTIY